MFVYAIKLIKELDIGILIGLDCKILGYVNHDTADQILLQRDKEERHRWANVSRNYNQIFHKFKGETIWFDAMDPLNVPERFLINFKYEEHTNANV